MNSSDVTATSAVAPGRATEPAPGDAERTKIRALAEQFESMLLAQMLREMKQAMTPDAEDHGLGGQMMGDAITTEMAMALGRSGSLGLSALVGTALERLDASGVEASAPDASAGPASPVAPAAAVVPAPLPGVAAVTSQYGWRTDPLDGRHRFHAGLDLRAAYGQEVRAATEGVVTFAGEKPGYGLVVEVSHGTGLETRYAHLSSAAVSQGEQVRAGDVIARSGRSGRATGPHLHFEVRQHGQPVDPGRVAGLLPTVGPRPGESD